MKLIVNGRDIEYNNSSLIGLIEKYKLKPEMIVVELNGIILDREQYSKQELNDGDSIELVRFVGGGQ